MAQSGSLSAEIESLRQLMEAFRAFDGDNDGRISAAELGGIMSSIGYNLNEQEVRRMMQEWDRNRDGLLSQAEFIEMNTTNMGIADGLGGLLESALEVLEGVESVSGEVLYEALCNAGLPTHLSMEDCVEIIAALDGDEDGAVSFEEFQTIVNSSWSLKLGGKSKLGESSQIIYWPYPFLFKIILNPILEFAKRLASKGLRVTFLIIGSDSQASQPEVGGVRFQSISDWIESGDGEVENAVDKFRISVSKRWPEFIRENVYAENLFTRVVYDSAMPWALNIVIGVPLRLVLHPIVCGGFHLLHSPSPGVRAKVDERGIVTREEIENCIREVIEGENREEIRNNSLKWKEAAGQPVDDGGNTDGNAEDFVAKLAALSLQNPKLKS